MFVRDMVTVCLGLGSVVGLVYAADVLRELLCLG